MNKAFVVEGIKLMNLVECDRVIENLVPGLGTVTNSRLADFFEDNEVLVYMTKEQQKQIADEVSKL